MDMNDRAFKYCKQAHSVKTVTNKHCGDVHSKWLCLPSKTVSVWLGGLGLVAAKSSENAVAKRA